MGIRFKRNYKEINQELVQAIKKIDRIFEVLGMEAKNWNQLQENKKAEYLKTLADDLFYALGTETKVEIGNGYLEYIEKQNKILVSQKDNCTQIINLV